MDAGSVQYLPRPPVSRNIDPYKAIITSRLEDFPKLTAQRLFEENQAAGDTGGYTRAKECISQFLPRR